MVDRHDRAVKNVTDVDVLVTGQEIAPNWKETDIILVQEIAQEPGQGHALIEGDAVSQEAVLEAETENAVGEVHLTIVRRAEVSAERRELSQDHPVCQCHHQNLHHGQDLGHMERVARRKNLKNQKLVCQASHHLEVLLLTNPIPEVDHPVSLEKLVGHL